MVGDRGWIGYPRHLAKSLKKSFSYREEFLRCFLRRFPSFPPYLTRAIDSIVHNVGHTLRWCAARDMHRTCNLCLPRAPVVYRKRGGMRSFNLVATFFLDFFFFSFLFSTTEAACLAGQAAVQAVISRSRRSVILGEILFYDYEEENEVEEKFYLLFFFNYQWYIFLC